MDKPYRGTGVADRAVRDGIAKALNQVGADLTGKAQRLAPKREGTLRASARWDVKGEQAFRAGALDPSDLEVVITFDVEYAEIQHEREDFNHTMGQAKYLEEPMKQNALAYRAFIEREIKQQLSRDL